MVHEDDARKDESTLFISRFRYLAADEKKVHLLRSKESKVVGYPHWVRLAVVVSAGLTLATGIGNEKRVLTAYE
jgi:hypothetical protein